MPECIMRRVYASLTCLLVVVMLASCSETAQPGHMPPRTEPEQIPVYPGAQEVETTSPRFNYRVTSFHAMSPSDEILKWYEDVMLQGGWQLFDQDPSGSTFHYVDGPDNPAYALGVVIISESGGRTAVELRLDILYPM
jgi:hypothetical protein